MAKDLRTMGVGIIKLIWLEKELSQNIDDSFLRNPIMQESMKALLDAKDVESVFRYAVRICRYTIDGVIREVHHSIFEEWGNMLALLAALAESNRGPECKLPNLRKEDAEWEIGDGRDEEEPVVEKPEVPQIKHGDSIPVETPLASSDGKPHGIRNGEAIPL
jgi:hypothetical protein